MKIDYNNKYISQLLKKGEFGLEKESLRVTHLGKLSQSKHPFPNDPHISRDFCENQTEIITDVFDSVDGVLDDLKKLHCILNEKLSSSGEYLWSFSNPPKFDTPDEIPIAEVNDNNYRNYLSKKYGKVKMLYSGIHLNFSFPQNVIFHLFNISGDNNLTDFKNKFYLSLSSKLVEYSWLIVYLTAASSVIDNSFLKHLGLDENLKYKYSSFRCSEIGYRNFFTPILDYTDLDGYIDSINRYINSGELFSGSELYYPVRLKPRGKNSLDSLKNKGVNHIELRMLDVNPLSEIGIFKEDIEFIHLLIIYLLSLGECEFTEQRQTEAMENMLKGSLYDDTFIFTENVSLKERALAELSKISDFTDKYYPEYRGAAEHQINKIKNSRRYAEIVRNTYQNDYNRLGLELSKKYREVNRNVYAFCG